MKKNEVDEDAIPESFEQLSEKKMWQLLAQLVDTPYFMAIKKYNRIKDVQAVTVLAQNDPFKDPTTSAQAQGIRKGIYYLEQSAEAEKKQRLEDSDEQNSGNV